MNLNQRWVDSDSNNIRRLGLSSELCETCSGHSSSIVNRIVGQWSPPSTQYPSRVWFLCTYRCDDDVQPHKNQHCDVRIHCSMILRPGLRRAKGDSQCVHCSLLTLRWPDVARGRIVDAVAISSFLLSY